MESDNGTHSPHPVTDEKNVPDRNEPEINTDERERFDWDSKYPDTARKRMKAEAIYVGVVLIISLLGLLSTWCGWISKLFSLCGDKRLQFEVILFYFFSGLLGGTIFGIKYFYRVVSRGYWSIDRIYWRIFSPWISSCIALIVGSMVLSGYIGASSTPSNSSGVCIGFVSGYFADEAVGKMSEVASALFGKVKK